MANKKLEHMMDEMKRLKKTTISDELMAELRSASLVMPAVLPGNTSPEAMRQFIENQGKNKPLPRGVNPAPCIIQNGQREDYLPLFTSMEELKRGNKGFPLSLNVKFDTAAEIVQKNENILGIVVNPFSHNLVMQLNRDKLQRNMEPEESEEITVEQYHALARRQMEAAYLPSQFFEKKGEMVERLCQGKGALLREMYEELYQEEVACPYTEEDFELLTLNISDSLQVTQIAMPEKNRYPHLCQSVIVGFDGEKNKIWYFAIVYEGKGKPSSLVQVIETGEPKNLGEAPAEGSEITRVMELMQGEE